MGRKTRRNRNVTPINKVKRDKGDVYFVLKMRLADTDAWHDLVVVPYRDMISNMILEGVGNYIGSIEGVPVDCSLLDANEDAGKALITFNEWTSDKGAFKVGTIFWVDAEDS